ncbi:methyltransferase [Legionella hackeliae]|uniref:Putative O-methyltransferase n=1 Tax=Legionella hackeliae TaxID=449 RepID=A0A0A8UVF9_LEGHA|nr:methyltransferase [Legionella hackeliae]KTD09601.1 O-methyltransferase [Legionella hackeliae]CEK11082.1 putative O-methyltransferase [Legionella hackeliae]STX47830.1 O-methyltransferase [Legionella hackeliae]
MQTHHEPAYIQLAIMSRWYVVSRAIHTMAKLGIANYMSLEPMKIETLAKLTDTVPDLLERLLKFLSAYQIVNCQDDTCSLTKLSLPLRDDDPHSIRDVLCMVDDSWWQAFSCLDTSLKTGNSAFSHQHGEDFFSFLSKHPEKQKNFDRGMAKLSTYDDNSIADAFNFSQCSHLIDMGGGRGGLVKALSQKYPHLKLTLFDTPQVINQLSNSDFSAQVELVAGDFLKSIPKVDAYMFKGVLHDFNDDFMHQILSNCYRQMPEDATLFIAEQVLPDNEGPHPNKTMDIVMMVLLGGRQRSLSEWQKSIEPAGFIYQDSYKTNSLFTLMRFKPRK